MDSLLARQYICQHEYNGAMSLARPETHNQLITLETLFKALADRTRLRILGLLLSGEICVCDIYSTLSIGQPKASRHLAYLRRAGLVLARKDGLWVHYRLAQLADPVMQVVVDAVAHALGHVATAARDRRRLATRVGAEREAAIPSSSARCCAGPESC